MQGYPNHYNGYNASSRDINHISDKFSSDLGFDEDSNDNVEYSSNSIPVDVHKYNEHIALLNTELKQSKKQLKAAELTEASLQQKINNIQSLNRSQVTMFKNEIIMNMRKKKRAMKLVSYYRSQVEFFLQNTKVSLPANLVDQPEFSDEDDADADSVSVPKPPSSLDSSVAPSISASAPITTNDNKDAVVAVVSPNVGGENAMNNSELESLKEKNDTLVKKLKQLATAYQSLQKKLKTYEDGSSASISVPTPPAPPTPTPPTPASVLTPSGYSTIQYSPKLKDSLKEVRKLQKDLTNLKNEVTDIFSSSASTISQEIMLQIGNSISKALGAAHSESDQLKDAYLKEVILRRALHNELQELKGNIRVLVRVRPILPKQDGANASSAISCVSEDEISITNPSTNGKKVWQFNRVLGTESSQKDLFDQLSPLITSALDGFSVCVFAYGQTGSGKTHSMQGTVENPGVYSRTFATLFAEATSRQKSVQSGSARWEFEFRVSVAELYLDDFRDLLRKSTADGSASRPPPRLTMRRDSSGQMSIPELTEQVITETDQVMACLELAASNRSVGKTNMNEHSSRSHLILTITIKSKNPESDEPVYSKLHLVDLAGSERLAKSGVEGMRAKEAVAINTSLSALGDVISALAAKRPHVPYRNSPLTNLLQDALGGDSKTLMLLQLNPTKDAYDESSCSLTFAARVNDVQTQSRGKR